MPISQGSAGGVPGLALKAWALVKSDGTLLKGLGVTSSSRSSLGVYVINFSVSTGTDYVCRTQVVGSQFPHAGGFLKTVTAASATVNMEALNGTDSLTDVTALWEFYE